jgi:hypothetical protein
MGFERGIRPFKQIVVAFVVGVRSNKVQNKNRFAGRCCLLLVPLSLFCAEIKGLARGDV